MTAYNPPKGIVRKYMREQIRDKSCMIERIKAKRHARRGTR